MRLIPVLTLSLAILLVPALASGPAEATDLRFHGASVLPPTGPPPARTPSVLKGGDPGIERDDDRRPGRPHRPGHPHHPGHGFQRPVFVFVSPGRCWQPGYWTYQWVPQTYTYSTDRGPLRAEPGQLRLLPPALGRGLLRELLTTERAGPAIIRGSR